MRISDWSSDVCSSDLNYRPEANSGYFRVFGKTTSVAVHELRISVPNDGAYADKGWDIRCRLIEKESVDADPNFEKRTITWESVSAGYNKKLGVTEPWRRSEEHTSELQSLMRISYAVF